MTGGLFHRITAVSGSQTGVHLVARQAHGGPRSLGQRRVVRGVGIVARTATTLRKGCVLDFSFTPDLDLRVTLSAHFLGATTQEPGIGAAMRLVTREAVTLADRSMRVGAGRVPLHPGVT